MAAVYGRECYVDFTREGNPSCQTDATWAVPTGADTEVTHAFVGDKKFELYFANTGAGACSDLAPYKSASTPYGLRLPNDNTVNEGAEMSLGIADGVSQCAYKVGTTSAFFFSATLTIPDVSDYDICAVGFRKVEAYAAIGSLDTPAKLITAYTDVALLNVNAGAIYTGTRLNSGVGTLTDTTNTWADAASKTLTVKVSAAGVVTFFINGVAPTVNTNTLTFDSGDVVVPFIRYTKGNNASDTPPILEVWHCGLQ